MLGTAAAASGESTCSIVSPAAEIEFAILAAAGAVDAAIDENSSACLISRRLFCTKEYFEYLFTFCTAMIFFWMSNFLKVGLKTTDFGTLCFVGPGS